jgi:Flp pilus assembly CpaF family ATPase/transcriptional regulator with XRE-family HTH domain
VAAARTRAPGPDGREREARQGADGDATFRRLLEGVRDDVGALLEARGQLVPGPEDDDAIRALIAARIAAEQRRAAALNVPGAGDPAALALRLFDHLRGSGPLEALLRDPEVEEVVINGPRVFAYRAGRKALVQELYFETEAEVLELVRRLIGPLGERLDEASPIVDAALPDGSRLHAVIPPAAVRWSHVNIRKHVLRARSLEELVGLGALPPEAAAFLRACVRARVSVVVAGSGGSGKTTLLRALLSEIDSDQERIVCCEDTPELRLHDVLPDAVSLQARPANAEGEGEITLRQLVRAALRMRPTRIIVGESRGPEALDVLQALNTGHEGRLCADARVHLTDGARRVGEYVDGLMAAFASRVVVRQEPDGPVEYLPIPPERPARVTSVAATGCAEATPVVYALRSRYRGTMLRLRTASGLTHTVSPEHPLYALRDGVDYVPAGELRIGDWLAAPRRLVWEGAPAGVGDAEGAGVAAASYWAGMMTGDGCISGNLGRRGRLAQTVHLSIDDAGIARQFEAHLADRFGATRVRCRVHPGGSLHVLECSSSAVARALSERYGLPVGRRTRATRLQGDVPARVPRDFVAGFFDAEGFVGLTERGTRDALDLNNCNLDYLSFVREGLLTEGIPIRIRRVHPSRSDLPTWSLVVTGRGPICRFTERIPIRHARKRSALLALAHRLATTSANPNVDVIPCTALLARRLAEARALGLTQDLIARRAGCAQTLVSHYARGVRHPTPARLARFAEALETLGVPCDDLRLLARADVRWERIVAVEPVAYDGYAYDLQVAEEHLSGALPHNFAADCLLTSNSLTSVHANSPRQALHKLITMAAAGPERLGVPAATRMVTQTVELVCFLEEDRRTQRRSLTRVAELANQEGDTLLMNDLWTLRPLEEGDPGAGPGRRERLAWTGIVPRCLEKIRRHGVPYALPPAPESAAGG